MLSCTAHFLICSLRSTSTRDFASRTPLWAVDCEALGPMEDDARLGEGARTSKQMDVRGDGQRRIATVVLLVPDRTLILRSLDPPCVRLVVGAWRAHFYLHVPNVAAIERPFSN